MAKRKKKQLKLDEVGYWSEVKLDIVRDYAKAYSTIFSAPAQRKFHHVYIDSFAGAGIHISKTTGEVIEGSPLIAVSTDPPFKEYHLIDSDITRVDSLQRMFGNRRDVRIHHGDCNEIMLSDVLPHVRYKDFRRGLCLLDPYGLHLRWDVIRAIGQEPTIDMFLNFPIADMNRNVFWRNPEGVAQDDIERMTAFWGDDSWREVTYQTVPTLFGPEDEKAADNDAIANAFQERLRKVAGFKNVPDPMPMRNSKGAIVYYLFFASPKPVAQHIVSHIFDKYRNRGAT
ncbi:MAG: three-Cys-motif partner protein TcmP [Gemmataceae bacterium]|nr:three-Cys-motif partner protein TcmP [Gemmataceae bacterium]